MARYPQWTFSVAVILTGCATAAVVKPDVIGPHGEHLVEVACNLPDGCMSLSREVCQGDFDVVTNGQVVSGGGGVPVTNANVMLVRCKTPPPSVPAASPAPSSSAPPPSRPGYARCASTFDCESGGTCIGGWCRM